LSLSRAINSICTRAFEFLIRLMLQPLLEGGEDLVLGATLHRHDEGKSEFLPVGIVELQEAVTLLRR
jgi:hypothetical protein